jgi:hypothetical protein
MDACKKCGSGTLFLRRVAALEVTLRRPAFVYESYCPICAWSSRILQAVPDDTRLPDAGELRKT